MFQLARARLTPRVASAWAAILFAALQGLSCTSAAEIYRWIDEDGGVHYGERWSAPGDARRLDIPLQGNDPPEASLACQTIQCQYERLRSDGERLRRKRRETDAAWEQELTDRERQARRRREAEDRERAAANPRSGQWILPRSVIRRPQTGGRPLGEQERPAADPGSPLRTPGPEASGVRPLR